jgi:hypothetical protein
MFTRLLLLMRSFAAAIEIRRAGRFPALMPGQAA